MYLVCLHNVIGEEADAFDQKCSRIAGAEFRDFVERVEGRYDLLSFSDFLRRLDEGRCDPRAVALTFDDGFRGVHRYAFPVLREKGLDAAAFVNPPFLTAADAPLFHFLEIEIAFRLTRRASVRLDFLAEEPFDLATMGLRVKAMKQVKRRLKAVAEAERRESHRRLLSALDVSPDALRDYACRREKFQVMDRGEVLALRDAGWTIGSHTLTHRSVGMLDDAELRAELGGAKRMLEGVLGRPDAVFAYPYGEPVHIGAAAPGVCRELGYRYAFTTVVGDNVVGSDPWLLKRVDYKEFRKDFLSDGAA